MFGKVIYYDENCINNYSAIMSNKPKLDVPKMELTKGKKVGAEVKAFQAEMSETKTFEATIQTTLLRDCAEFENMLHGRPDFFDMVESNDFDLSTMERGCIFKLNGYVAIPEEFDIIQALDKFKTFLPTDTVSQGKEFVDKFLGTQDAKMPVIIDGTGFPLCSKLNYKSLTIPYEDLQSYESLEVTILARMIVSNMLRASNSFFDPLRDFILLNRQLRRSVARSEGLREIFSNEDYKNIEVIAMYQ